MHTRAPPYPRRSALWCLLTLLYFIISLRKTPAFATILALLVFNTGLMAGGVHDARARKASGYFGWLCASAALYTGFAGLVQSELGVTLPGLAPCRYI